MAIDTTHYDSTTRTLTLTYKDGHQVRVRNVKPEQAARLMTLAHADAKRADSRDLSHFTR